MIYVDREAAGSAMGAVKVGRKTRRAGVYRWATARRALGRNTFRRTNIASCFGRIVRRFGSLAPPKDDEDDYDSL